MKMFLMRKFWFTCTIAVALWSCTTEKGQKENHIRDIALEDFQTDTLFRVQLDVEVPGLIDLWCLEDVSLLRTRDPDRVFYVLNNKTYDIIGDFGYKGEAPADFMYPRHFTPLGGNSAWITDMGLRRMYRIDLQDKTFPNPKNIISKSVSLMELGSEINYGMDESTVFGAVEDGRDSTVFFVKDLTSGDQMATFSHMTYRLPKKYRGFSPAQKEVYAYKATAMKPDRSKMVLAHYFSPYVSVVSTEGVLEHIVSLHQLDRNSDISNVGFEDELYAIFEGVAVTDRHIYVIHNMQRNEDVTEIRKPVEILVFDWELNPVHRFLVDEYVLSIGAFMDDRVLLGVDYTSEAVYRYRLPYQ